MAFFQKMIISGANIEIFRGVMVDRTVKRERKSIADIRTYLDELALEPKYENNSLIHDPPLHKTSEYYERILDRHNFRLAMRSVGLDSAYSRFLADDSVRRKSANRAITTLSRIIYSNAGRYTDTNGVRIPLKFLTLTFRSAKFTDIVLANREFTRYFRSLDYEFKQELSGRSLMYAGTHEPQRRGVIHYHVLLFNFPYADKVYSRLRKKWLSDSPQIRLVVPPVDRATSFGVQYLTKYISKGMNDHRLFRKKRYLSSRGLLRPIVSRNDEIISLYEETFDKNLLGSREFSGDWFSGRAFWYQVPGGVTVMDYLKLGAGRDIVSSVQQQLLFDDSMRELR